VALTDDIAALIVTPAAGGTTFLADQAVLHAAAKDHQAKVTANAAAVAAGVKTVNGTAPDGSGNVTVTGGAATTDAGALTTGTLADARLSTATTTALGKAGTAVQPAGLTKAAVGLGNVDNTADLNKPVSTAQTAAFVGTADTRLTNSRTPTAHAATHTTGGSDALTAANVGAEPTITRTGGVTGWVPTLQAGGTLALAAPAGGGAAAATTTTQGIVKLAGALGGTADLPTVPGLALKADLVSGIVPSAQLPPLNFGTGLSYDAPSSTLSATATGAAATPVVSSPGGTTKALAASTVNDLTLTAASCALTLPTGLTSGVKVTLDVVTRQDATGGHVVTYPTAVLWPGGTQPTAATASHYNVVTLTTYDGGVSWTGDPVALNVPAAVVVTGFTFADSAATPHSLVGGATGVTQPGTGIAPGSANSVVLDGTAGYLAAGTNLVGLGVTNAFTWECWIKPTRVVGGADVAIMSTLGNSQDQAHLYISAADGTIAGVLQIGTGANYLSSSTAVTANAAHHVALSWNGTKGFLALDGVVTPDPTTYPGTIAASTNKFTVGLVALPGGGNPFPGTVDEVRVSNTARYTANYTVPTVALTADANTVALWHLEAHT
jgi:hypothetical protein